MTMPDPFPYPPPLPPIIPVEDEDIDEPDTGSIEACVESDPLTAQKMARQKLRSMAQKIDRKYTPTPGVRVPSAAPKKG